MMFAHNSEEVIESDEYGEAVFDDEVMYPEVDNLFTLNPSTLNMCTQSVQLKVGPINKSSMGVHAHYRKFAIFKQYLCFIWILGLSEVHAFFKFILPRSTQVPHYKCIFVQYIST